jgi:tryptophanyl-tRNA synthetase
MHKPVILTGLRANNELHLGNYLGALLPLIDMAKNKAGEFQINLFVPDLHSFTTPVDHSKLQAQIMNNLRVFVAAGLPIDNENVFIYRQSYIAAHSELTWLLDCFTGFGEMSRMTQFKDKTELINDDRVSVGLFNYPVLMAADILLYDAQYVPIGDDQSQHLEFTRDIAERMNAKFGDLFVVPYAVNEQRAFFGQDQGLRIRNLQDPSKKMSKSDELGAKGVIFLTDSPEEAKAKIMSATTDDKAQINYDYSMQPGISNLLDIFKLLGGETTEFLGHTQYGDFKSKVADKIANFLINYQAKIALVDDHAIIQKLEASEMVLREVANQKLHKVQQAVGLRS